MMTFLEFIAKELNESFSYHDEDFDDGPLHATLAQRLSRDSSLQNHKIGNVDVVASQHAGARVVQRHPDSKPEDWHQFSKNVVSYLKTKGNTPSKEVMLKSKSLGHAVVANIQYNGDKKQIRYVTVLPKNKHVAAMGTQKIMIESEVFTFEEIEID